MKQLYNKMIIVVLALLIQLQPKAQGIHKFWGQTVLGGEHEAGVVFSTKTDGNGIKVEHAFKYKFPGASNWNMPLVPYNGKFYGTTSADGKHLEGYIFEYDFATGEYRKCADLANIGGRGYVTALTLYNNKLYGATHWGGDDDRGILFEFDPVSRVLVKKYDFASTQGYYPNADLSVYNGRLYSVTQYGGAHNVGTVFQFDPATSVLEEQASFHPDNTGWDMRAPFRLYNNKLYGVCQNGGSKDSGTIVEFNPQTNTLVQKADFALIGAGDLYFAGFTLFNGKFYGGSESGGANGVGLIYEFNPATGTLVKKVDLTVSGGYHIQTPLIGYGSKLYGTCVFGGNTGEGVLFEYDPATNTYTKKVNFGGAPGATPYAPMFHHNNKLYGISLTGGLRNKSILYEYDPQINGIKPKGYFDASDGHMPAGDLTLYKGKLYGTTAYGGEQGYGVIFSYDLASRTYSVLHHMDSAHGHMLYYGGLTLHNDKFYGVAFLGGVDDVGTIYEFDPATNVFTKKYDIGSGNGQYARCKLLSYNNLLYGTTVSGGNNNGGVLFSYDPSTNTFSEKVHFYAALGINPMGTLVPYNGKLYGVTFSGGAHFNGTIFEYNPVNNGIIKRHDFEGSMDGKNPEAGLTLMNDKLYGVTYQGDGDNVGGTLFEYNPANFTCTKIYSFADGNARPTNTTLHAYRGRLYGMTITQNGKFVGEGALFEYNPGKGTVTEKDFFNQANGRWPNYTKLTAVPAPVAHGTPGNCEMAIVGEMPNAHNQWMSFTDAEGNAVVEINPNGNDLGRVIVHYYVHDGATRTDNQGKFYLNRNISIEVENQPVRPVMVRLYVRATEIDALGKTEGSGVMSAEDIAVFKNDDACSNAIQASAGKLDATVEPWGFDYVYTVTVTSFSSFYFASNSIVALPVELEYFRGSELGASNKLEWKADCTNDVDFIVERSINGIQFEQIGLVWAAQGDCYKPFTFIDDKVPAGKCYYRLKMDEKNGDLSYSKSILLSRELLTGRQAVLFPNPVAGSQVTLRIHAPKQATMQAVISDITGRKLMTKQIHVQQGLNDIPLQVQHLPPGVYQLVYNDQVIRFVKQ